MSAAMTCERFRARELVRKGADFDAVYQRRASASDGLLLIRNGRDLVFYITRARTPMPKSTREYIERCETYLSTGFVPLMPSPLPA